jgi:lysosomal alpha-mannosidase
VPAPWSALAKRALPENVHLMTLTTNYAVGHLAGTVLLRLQHRYEADEHPTLSQPATVSLKDVFSTLALGTFLNATEMTLTANNVVEKKLSYQWGNVSNSAPSRWEKVPYNISSSSVTLNPLEIRTFLVEFDSNLKKTSERTAKHLRSPEDFGQGTQSFALE